MKTHPSAESTMTSPYEQLYHSQNGMRRNGYQEIMEACRPFYALAPEPSWASLMPNLPPRIEDSVVALRQQQNSSSNRPQQESTALLVALQQSIPRSVSPEVSFRFSRLVGLENDQSVDSPYIFSILYLFSRRYFRRSRHRSARWMLVTALLLVGR